LAAFILLAIAVCALPPRRRNAAARHLNLPVIATDPAAFDTSKQGEKWLIKQVENIQRQYEVWLKAILSEYQRSGEGSFLECDTRVVILD